MIDETRFPDGRVVRVIADQWVCLDCLMFIANGDMPDHVNNPGERSHGSDPIPEGSIEAAILAGIEREKPYEWVCEGPHEGEDEGADCRDFSWHACACCRSRLGGDRGRCALVAHLSAEQAAAEDSAAIAKANEIIEARFK